MAITNLPSLLWGDGDDNMGGLRTVAYYALHSDFTASGHPEPAARDAATALNDLVQIDSAPTFNSGKGWKQFYVTEDTSMVESELQGEKDGRSWINKFSGFTPGNKAQLLGFFRYITNAGVYFIGDSAEGTKQLVGSRYWPAKLESAVPTTANTTAGRKGITFEFRHAAPYPAPICTFAIAEESGS